MKICSLLSDVSRISMVITITIPKSIRVPYRRNGSSETTLMMDGVSGRPGEPSSINNSSDWGSIFRARTFFTVGKAECVALMVHDQNLWKCMGEMLRCCFWGFFMNWGCFDVYYYSVECELWFCRCLVDCVWNENVLVWMKWYWFFDRRNLRRSNLR